MTKAKPASKNSKNNSAKVSQNKVRSKVNSGRTNVSGTKKLGIKKNGKKNGAGKASLKRSTSGFEVEFFILDKNGRAVNAATKLLKEVAKQKRNENAEIVLEMGDSMIEVGSYPDVASSGTLSALLDNIKLLLYTADEMGLYLCPLGTYPGTNNPKLHQNTAHYKAKLALFGPKRWRHEARCAGYHFHYAMPWGVFDTKHKRLKKLINSKNKQSLVNAHNFLVAADPALTTFMQSSPFYQGKYLGKDSRAIMYRGLGKSEGLFSNFPDFGALPSYRHTVADMISKAEQRFEGWIKLITGAGVKNKDLPRYPSKLDTNWTPVRINKHGTIEQRGMDMNHPLIMYAVSVMTSKILEAIQERFYTIETSEVAIAEPFKVVKKVIFVPPDTYVKKELQTLSVNKGMDSDVIHRYCRRLVELAKILEPKKKPIKMLDPLEKMLKNKKTVSDEIISQARKLGHKDLNKPLPEEVSAKIALDHAKRLYQEVVLVQKLID